MTTIKIVFDSHHLNEEVSCNKFERNKTNKIENDSSNIYSLFCYDNGTFAKKQYPGNKRTTWRKTKKD